MKNIELKEFAEKLMKLVRDKAIQNGKLSGIQGSNPVATRWKNIANKGNLKELQKTIIIDTVDDTIFCLLDAIDNNTLKLKFEMENGKQIDLSKDGNRELAGWFSSNDWKKKYSTEEFFDDFKDLNLDF